MYVFNIRYIFIHFDLLRFFEFTCTVCNGLHEETITRLDLSLVDSLHLTLFNLILSKNQKFHDLDSAIIPFMKKNIKYLQVCFLIFMIFSIMEKFGNIF